MSDKAFDLFWQHLNILFHEKNNAHKFDEVNLILDLLQELLKARQEYR